MIENQEQGSELKSEFGPLAELMADPTIEEIWINSPHRVFIARAGVSQLTNIVLSTQEVRDLVERLLMWGGRRLDLSHPFVDARLPDGSRLHVAIPEVTAMHWAVNIRKHLIRGKSLKDLAELDVMSTEMADFLERAVASGLNILVSGSTQAGKTTLLNALVSTTPFHNRVITIEEVFELKPRLPDCIALQTRPANLQGEGEIPLRKLIKEALRMRPSQIVVGEIREAEALDLLIALNSGLPGMATIHANSARDAIAKLQTLPLLAGENISYQFVAPIVASTIDLVIHTTILRDTGERRIVEIAHITGRIEGDRVEIEPLFTFEEGVYQRGLLDPFRLVEGVTSRSPMAAIPVKVKTGRRQRAQADNAATPEPRNDERVDGFADSRRYSAVKPRNEPRNEPRMAMVHELPERSFRDKDPNWPLASDSFENQPLSRTQRDDGLARARREQTYSYEEQSQGPVGVSPETQNQGSSSLQGDGAWNQGSSSLQGDGAWIFLNNSGRK